MSIIKEKKQELITSFAIKQGDTGSPEVQCAILTERINSLTGHFKANFKDFQSKRGLLVMIVKRKRLLQYLKRKSESRYQDLIKRLGLRK